MAEPTYVFGTKRDYVEIPTRGRFKYAGGRPVGSGITPNMVAWTASLSSINCLDDMRTMYSYTLIEKVAPWVQTARAGIVLVDIGTPEPTVLVIYERPMQYRVMRGKREQIVNVDVRAGFPKGAREPADATAFDTARREMLEETGVDVVATGARLAPMTFVIPRSETGELFMWFVAVVTNRPKIAVQNSEIAKYEWVPLSRLTGLASMTNPTRMLVGALSRVDMSRASKLIALCAE